MDNKPLILALWVFVPKSMAVKFLVKHKTMRLKPLVPDNNMPRK
jgi:hypothetical protein